MTDLAIGVIGYGLRGGLSRHAHRPGEGSRVVALYDPDVDAHEGQTRDHLQINTSL